MYFIIINDVTLHAINTLKRRTDKWEQNEANGRFSKIALKIRLEYAFLNTVMKLIPPNFF
jgi:hypothetical protein